MKQFIYKLNNGGLYNVKRKYRGSVTSDGMTTKISHIDLPYNMLLNS